MSDAGTPAGRPYGETAPSACQFITDDHRFAVRMCGDPAAWRGCSWCWRHLEKVAQPSTYAKLRNRFLGARAAA